VQHVVKTRRLLALLLGPSAGDAPGRLTTTCDPSSVAPRLGSTHTGPFSKVSATPNTSLQGALRASGEASIRSGHGAAPRQQTCGQRFVQGGQHISSREEVGQSSSEQPRVGGLFVTVTGETHK